MHVLSIWIDVADGKVCMNGTTIVPKSVLRYVVDKVKLIVPMSMSRILHVCLMIICGKVMCVGLLSLMSNIRI